MFWARFYYSLGQSSQGLNELVPKTENRRFQGDIWIMMNDFKEAIKHEQSRIQKLVDLTGKSNWSEKRGTLIADKRDSGIYCYEKRGNSKKYLGKADSEAARDCARYHYLVEKRNRLLFDLDLLETLAQQYKDYGSEAILSALSASCRIIAGEDFNNARYEELKQWANADYEKNQAPFPDSKIYAIDGTRVRSKGECLHYNILLGLGIPFRYDSIIEISDGRGNTKKVSPDFLIQNFDSSLTTIEHLGRLFDKRYALDYGEKCYWYLKAGFIPGKNFFVTSDDIYGGTDTQSIMETAKAVERLFYGEWQES